MKLKYFKILLISLPLSYIVFVVFLTAHSFAVDANRAQINRLSYFGAEILQLIVAACFNRFPFDCVM